MADRESRRAATDRELVEHWVDQPAPLLGLLHAFHDRDGFVSDDALREVSRALRIPLAELFGTVTFYHHFARESEGRRRPRVCTGPVCRHNGAAEILDALSAEGARHVGETRRRGSRWRPPRAGRRCLTPARVRP